MPSGSHGHGRFDPNHRGGVAGAAGFEGEANGCLGRIRPLALLIATAVLAGIAPEAGSEPVASGCSGAAVSRRVIATETLDVLNLNLGHGRGTALNQMLVSADRHRRNLEDVAALLLATGADVVALQEADAPSLWSGRFDHVGFLSEKADYPCSIHGHHADSWLYTFGTALMSRVQLGDVASYAFRPSPPTPTKGFVRGTLQWQSGGDSGSIRPVTVISVHLDFSRHQVREAQIAEMVDALAGASAPLIILGDFNEGWAADDSTAREIAREFGLHAYRPTAKEFGTYKEGHRLDWILISKDLRFVGYAVLPELVSDHLALVAEIGWVEGH